MTKQLLWDPQSPIVRRIDENDVYKILMMYLIWNDYPNLNVKFGFKNRTKSIVLPDHIDVLQFQEELRAVEKLRFTDDVLSVYRKWQMFPEDFLIALKDLKLSAPTVEREDDELKIVAEGSWFEVTLWEIYTLSIIAELFGRSFAKKNGISEMDLFKAGNERLDAKIELFKRYPALKISQFGLRRRFSGLWEEHVTVRFLDECPGLITGVSNMYLADKLDIEAQGTNAHELPMALVALARHTSSKAVRDAPYKVLKLWQRLYGHKSLIILDDTYGSDVFRAELPRHYLEAYRGFRHDSGDPFTYGDDTIKLYEKYGIDPTTRILIFSDGLNPDLIIKLLEYFQGRIMVAFGVGTNLTNDFGLVLALSLVMKITEAAGNPAVKLSNNLNKATGDLGEIEEIKRIFEYTNTLRETIVY